MAERKKTCLQKTIVRVNVKHPAILTKTEVKRIIKRMAARLRDAKGRTLRPTRRVAKSD
jgi:hypothetical protein